jgi:uncharacterized protein (TIGR02246 family)
MRKIVLVSVLAVGAMIAASSWAQQPGLSAADMEKFNASFAAAWAKGDAEAVAGHYTQDAVRIGMGQETQNGRAAIQKYFTDTLSGASKGSKIVLRTLGTKVLSNDVSVVHGTFEVTGPGARSGRYLNTVVRQPGGWSIASSAAIQDQPPAK